MLLFTVGQPHESTSKTGLDCKQQTTTTIAVELKLELCGTLFPRIPVPVQKDLEVKLRQKGLCDDHKRTAQEGWGEAEDFVRRTRGDRWVSLAKN